MKCEITSSVTEHSCGFMNKKNADYLSLHARQSACSQWPRWRFNRGGLSSERVV